MSSSLHADLIYKYYLETFEKKCVYIYINIDLDAKQIIYNGRKEKNKYIKLQSYV